MNSNGKPFSDPQPDPKSALGAATNERGVATNETSLDVHANDPELAIKLDATAQALIGQRLKAIYNEVVQEDVPDHLLKLLDELERKERRA